MENSRLKSLVLLSGGLDSSANLAFARHYDTPLLALTIDYGQRAVKKEIEASAKLAAYYEVPHQVLDLRWLGALGGSALTSTSIDVPKMETAKLDDLVTSKSTARQVWVPNRNGLFINAAAAIAESKKIQQVIVGFNKEEAATFPDNSSQFLGVATLSLRYSTGTGVKVACYTDMMMKTEIVQALRNLATPFPFEMVWSCYLGGEKMCGECESCKRFYRATGKS
ncbi:MAG: 7-cyano-7-deazaguanine synthase QueC [Bdellovibrionales bacterium]|nr:7-cyano-7-deazaguanine synthase QueC [Oligoflexia bacterium]